MMDESIVAPIGLVMGIITTFTSWFMPESQPDYNHKNVTKNGLFRKIHSPIQERSPPLSNL